MKKSKRQARRSGLLAILLVIMAGGAVWCGIRLYGELEPELKAEGFYAHVREQVKETGRKDEARWQGPDFEALVKMYPDIAAWVDGADIGIDYPVMQGEDNSYYLHHLPDKTPSEIGSVFLDYENNPRFEDDLTSLYGHHTTMDRMFSPLSHYKEQDFYEKHPVLTIYTKDKRTYALRLFAGRLLQGNEAFPRKFENDQKKKQWITEQLAASTFQSGLVPTEKDRMAALVTCSYEFGDARYAVIGILEEKNEVL